MYIYTYKIYIYIYIYIYICMLIDHCDRSLFSFETMPTRCFFRATVLFLRGEEEVYLEIP